MHKYAAPTALAIALNITAAAAQTAPTCEAFLVSLRHKFRLRLRGKRQTQHWHR